MGGRAKWVLGAVAALALAAGLLVLRAPLAPPARQAPARGADGYYHDRRFGFKVRFPPGWALAEGGGNVAVKAVDPAVPADMSVMITALPAGLKDVDAARLLATSQEKVRATLAEGGGKLLEAKLVPFAGAQAAYMRIDAPYAEPRETKRAINEQYVLVRGGAMVSVTATVRAEDAERRAPDIAAAVQSFSFE